MRSILAALFLGLTLAFGPAPAAALEAEELKSEIEAMLEEARNLIAPTTLQMGPIGVEPEGDGFRVTLPDIVATNEPMEDSVVIGTVSLLVTAPGPGLFGFEEVRLPKRMSMLEGGKEVGWIALDLERLSGVYSAAVQDFLQLDFAARSFELRVPAESGLIGAGQMTAWVATVAEHEDGIATGYQRQRQYLSVADLIFADDEQTVEIDSIIADGAVDGFDLRLYETLIAVIADLEIAAAQGNTARIHALHQAVAEATAIAKSFGGGVRIAGLEAFDVQGKRSLRLESLHFAMGLETPRDAEFGAAKLSLSGQGLSIDPTVNPEIAPYLELLPQSWSIPIAVEHLPLDALAKSVADLVVASAQSPLQAEEDMKAIGNAVLSALGVAGSYLIIRDLFVEAPLLRVDSKASLAFSPAVEWGVVGNWALTLTGLDRVLAMAEAMSDPDAKRILSAVVLGMMGVGQAVALPDGRVGYRFVLFFAPDGSIKMNGFSFGDLLNNAIPQ